MLAAQRKKLLTLFGQAAHLGAGSPQFTNCAVPSGGMVLQRMISGIEETSRGIRVSTDDHRPRGNIPDKDGDHTTPFVTLQHEVENAICGVDLDTAWKNLALTYAVYRSLPGWGSSKKSVQQGVAELGGYTYDVGSALVAKGDLAALLNAVNGMLALRNQIDLSAMEGKKKKGVGHAESDLSGGLHFLEKSVRAGAGIGATQDAVMNNMGMLFDHGRNDGRRDPGIAANTWVQHCLTVVSAYPEVSAAAKITADDLIPLRAHYSKQWHARYG